MLQAEAAGGRRGSDLSIVMEAKVQRWTLTAPVGLGQPNRRRDVRIVQQLLNRAESGDPASKPLVEDGFFGSLTQTSLMGFQKRHAHLARPDSIVAPQAPSERALNNFVRPRATAPERRPFAPFRESGTAFGRGASAPAPVPRAAALTPTVPKVDAQGGLQSLMLRRAAEAKPSHKSAWFNRALPAAIHVKLNWGVPIAVTLAQGALESNWGRSAPGNVFFGVKGKSPAGDGVKVATHEVRDGRSVAETDEFRAYDSLEQSAEDYGRFLRTNQRYAHAFNFGSDPDMFIHMVAIAGYATDPHYEAKIKSIMAANGLKDYDAAGGSSRPTFKNAAHE